MSNKSLKAGGFNAFSMSTYFVLAAIFIVFSFLTPNFLTLSNIYSTLLNGTPLIIITCAITFALMTGTFDLSVGATGYAAGCLAGIIMKSTDLPVAAAFLLGILLAVGLGGLNSLQIVKFNMNSMLTTLGMMLIIRGIGKLVTENASILLSDLGNIRQVKWAALGDFPVIIIIAVAIVVVSQVILKWTPFGRNMIAVGCNEKAARNVGINTNAVRTGALILTSTISGIGGIFWIITLGSVNTRGLSSYEFLSIASAVLGGTSLFGGRGDFFPGSFIGALIFLFIANGLSVIGTSPFIIPLIRGVIIFVAMYADSLRSNRGLA